jgi:hypothetical protein
MPMENPAHVRASASSCPWTIADRAWRIEARVLELQPAFATAVVRLGLQHEIIGIETTGSHLSEWLTSSGSDAATSENVPLIIVTVSNPAAFSGKGGLIVLESTDAAAAAKVTRKIARETGRCVSGRFRFPHARRNRAHR